MDRWPSPRRRTDRLSVRQITPRAQEAFDLIAAEPGLSVEALGDKLGVSRSRIWQLVGELEYGRIRRDRPYRYSETT
jgi:DNA-binding IclR family transcriptional regulator